MPHTTNKLSLRITMSILMVLACAVGFSAVYRVAANAHGNDEAAVRDTLLKSALGFEKNDLALLTKVWANDESLTVFESGHANYGWADYRDHHLVPEMSELKNTKYTLSDIKVHVVGKTAWATFKTAISADTKDRHVDGTGLGTAILEERDGRWQIVHWHSSAPRRAPASVNPAGKKE